MTLPVREHIEGEEGRSSSKPALQAEEMKTEE